jgi:hypothetical protein
VREGGREGGREVLLGRLAGLFGRRRLVSVPFIVEDFLDPCVIDGGFFEGFSVAPVSVI